MSEPCPTCSWPSRETVGMVCQTCGVDYSTNPPSLSREWLHAQIQKVRVQALRDMATDFRSIDFTEAAFLCDERAASEADDE